MEANWGGGGGEGNFKCKWPIASSAGTKPETLWWKTLIVLAPLVPSTVIFYQMTTNFSNVACLFIEKSIFNAVNFHKFRLKKTKYFEKELPRITNFCKAQRFVSAKTRLINTASLETCPQKILSFWFSDIRVCGTPDPHTSASRILHHSNCKNSCLSKIYRRFVN